MLAYFTNQVYGIIIMNTQNQFTHQSATKALLITASAMLVLSSCQEEDFGYDIADVRQSVYARNFHDAFGDIDPNHNWSMAQAVKVNLLVPNATGYRVRILTEAPTNRESIVLYHGMMTSEQLSVNVDVIRGTRNLYVELKSELGTYLVDGYYNINNEGIVEVNKMAGTRAEGSAPACSVYTTTLTRWSRTWSETATTGSKYQWDYGFVNRADHLASGNNVIPTGWIIGHNGSERPSGSSQDSGTRAISISNSQAIINGTAVATPSCIVFQSTKDNKAYAKYGYVDGQSIHSDGNYTTTIHVPLAYYNDNENNFTLTVQKKSGSSWTTVKEENRTITQKYSGNSDITFQDVVIDIFTPKGEAADYGIIIRFNTDNTSTRYSVCAGCCIETPSWIRQPYTENINGYITYRDVRGGGVNLWSQNLTLRDCGTFRNNASNTTFLYRSFDVEQMTAADKAEGIMGPFYIINGENGAAIPEGTEKIKYRDQFPLYGLYKSTFNGQWKGSPFREGDNHIDPFFTDGSFHQASDFEMQKDAQITTLGAIHSAEVNYDGSVSIKLVGIGTGWGNDVGYFYYPKSEESTLMRSLPNGEKALDFNRIPKVIIRKNMQDAISNADQPWKFIEGATEMQHYGLGATQFSRYVDGCMALNMTSDEFANLIASGEFKRYESNEYRVKEFIDYFNQSGKEGQKALAKEATFDAPIYKLPYYGWSETDGKYLPTGTATYEWPKDMVIGFFGIRTDGNVAAELSRIYTSSASVQRNYFNDLPRGSAFSYKGKNYIGLEDEWDYDNNDFLFEIMGVQSVDPDITPEDDIVDTKTTQDWLIACEDLGGVWDYDFNDLVWAVTKEVNTTTTIKYDGTSTEVGTTDIYFTPLAAGGTLDARVEYNTSIALGPGEDGWVDNAWISLGEIHQMVTRNPEAPTNVQVNVDPKDTWGITKDRIGQRIKLGTTIPTNDQAITIESILSHFRIRVKHNDGEYVVANVKDSRPEGSDHNHEHGGSLNYGNGKSHAPQFILLPKGWAWPAEAVCITDVYGLQNWFQNKNDTGWLDAWKKSNNGKSGKYIISPI